MAKTEHTGYAPADVIIDVARLRGLNVTINRYDGGFVAIEIDNRGLAGENGLNDSGVTMYISFRSSRGRWCGAHRWSLLGKDVDLPRRGVVRRGQVLVRGWVENIYVTAEKTTDADRERKARDRAEYEAQRAQMEAGT